MPLIRFQNVSKWYPHATGRQLLRGHILRWFTPALEHHKFQALKQVSFDLEPGESLALVGANGAGKSTLLALAARLATPDQGTVEVNGRVAALLELGSGFHPDLTGGENLLMNASLLGVGRKRAAELFDRIVDFSGIEEFIGDPLRTYSSGMVMRLAFSIAIHTDADIILIDEVLAVGDAAFQLRCMEALFDFRRNGKSILFVSHAATAVRKMCDRALWLDRGEAVMMGDVSEVLEAYEGRLGLETQAGSDGVASDSKAK
jgi:ABC-type polysaccharide/polyol phosphate transport system ATPase subunit